MFHGDDVFVLTIHCLLHFVALCDLWATKKKFKVKTWRQKIKNDEIFKQFPIIRYLFLFCFFSVLFSMDNNLSSWTKPSISSPVLCTERLISFLILNCNNRSLQFVIRIRKPNSHQKKKVSQIDMDWMLW